MFESRVALEKATYDKPCSLSDFPSLITTLPLIVCPCAFQIVHAQAKRSGTCTGSIAEAQLLELGAPSTATATARLSACGGSHLSKGIY
jgi:hypothetical protein